MMGVYDVVFLGAGPASLFAANYLYRRGFKDFLILEKGFNLGNRILDIEKK